MSIKLNYINVIIIILSFISCNKDIDLNIDNTSDKEHVISLQNSYDLSIDEPSGLSFFDNGDLLCVDDNTNKIYRISTQGNPISKLSYIGNDLEGITYNSISNRIYTIHEGQRKLIELDLQGNVLNEWQFTVSGGTSNNGFEGLSIDEDNEVFYILNETSPGLLIKWDYKTKTVIKEIDLNFAKDYSGVFYDKFDNSLWIISDKSQQIFHTDTEANVLESFDLDYSKAEGIVVDAANKLIYIARDYKSNIKLYIYKISDKK